MVDHPNIKSATSIVDFIFRSLAYEYLGRTDLVHVLDRPEVANTGVDDWDEIPTSLEYDKSTLSSAMCGSWQRLPADRCPRRDNPYKGGNRQKLPGPRQL